jgi:hypothetical protein
MVASTSIYQRNQCRLERKVDSRKLFLIFYSLSYGQSISIIFVWVLEKGRFGQVDNYSGNLYVASALPPRLGMQRSFNASNLPGWI